MKNLVPKNKPLLVMQSHAKFPTATASALTFNTNDIGSASSRNIIPRTAVHFGTLFNTQKALFEKKLPFGDLEANIFFVCRILYT